MLYKGVNSALFVHMRGYSHLLLKNFAEMAVILVSQLKRNSLKGEISLI